MYSILPEFLYSPIATGNAKDIATQNTRHISYNKETTILTSCHVTSSGQKQTTTCAESHKLQQVRYQVATSRSNKPH